MVGKLQVLDADVAGGGTKLEKVGFFFGCTSHL